VTKPANAPSGNASHGELRMPRMNTLGVPTEKSKDFGTSSRRLLRRMHPERARLTVVLVAAVVSVVCVVIGPRLLGHATNEIFEGWGRQRAGVGGIDYGELHRTLWIVFAIYLASYIIGYLQAFTLAGAMQRTMYGLRRDVEAKLHRVPLSYIDGQQRGELLSRVSNDIDNLAQSVTQSVNQLLTGVLTVIGTIVMMFSVSWQLALIALVTIPLSLWSVKQIAGRSRGKFIAQWKYTGQLNGQVEETFTGHNVVRAFGQQATVRTQFDETNDKLFRSGFMASFISGTIQPAMVFFGNINYVLVAVFGGLKVANGSIGVGDVQAFIQYSRQFAQPLSQTASMANVLQSGIASAERVFEVLDAPEESDIEVAGSALPGDGAGNGVGAGHGVAQLESVRGHVEFRDVSFSYVADRPLIRGLDLIVEPGRTVAIVGPTGAGKTTMVNLLMRYYELDGGAILIDGHDITSMPRQQLRRHMGMVLQDTWLFGGTIRDNLRYGNPDATDDELRAAAKACYVDRFVRALPMGYDTVLDDDGTSVSAGEKQLLTIARAFLADPAILILDEATSSVDTRTELMIQRAMNALRADRTCFIIAHRLSTIRDADAILVMDGGRIVEQGNHTELVAAGGAYHALYTAQFTGAAATLQ
jgi:ATP-binding cassette, subfamily B, multidrug efflux pump